MRRLLPTHAMRPARRLWLIVLLGIAPLLIAAGVVPAGLALSWSGVRGEGSGCCAMVRCCCTDLGLACSCAPLGGGDEEPGSDDEGPSLASLDCVRTVDLLLSVVLVGGPVGDRVAVGFWPRSERLVTGASRRVVSLALGTPTPPPRG